MKRFFFRPIFILLIAGVAGVVALLAQTAGEPNEGSLLSWDETNQIYRYKWWGQAGRTYFIQTSTDLLTWNWVPIIEPGDDSIKEWGFTSTASKFFIRLKYTDILTTDPINGDFDGDGLSNMQELTLHSDPTDFSNRQNPDPMEDSDNNELPDWWEIQNFGQLGNDPNALVPGKDDLKLKDIFDHDLDLTKSSTTGDDIPDSWKIQHGLDPLDVEIVNQDPDGDGLTNGDEYDAGTNPMAWDSDGDYIADGSDLYPMLSDPSTPGNFRVTIPSWDEQNESSNPDWNAVDYTSIELKWEASTNGATAYKIERREDNDIWHEITTVSSTSHEDSGLVANRHYQYRIWAIKTAQGSEVKSVASSVTYEVPLNLRMSVKRSSLLRGKEGFTEFVNPSSPPKYYLVKTDSSTLTGSYSIDEEVVQGSGSWNGQHTYVETVEPSLHRRTYSGNYSYSESSSTVDTGYSSSSQSSYFSDHQWTEQGRTKQNLTRVTEGSASSEYSESSTNEFDDYQSDSSGETTGSYQLSETYEPNSEPARWLGNDFDLAIGNLSYAGTSAYTNNSSDDSSSESHNSTSSENTSANSSANSTGAWSGSSTFSSNYDGTSDSETTSLSGPAWSGGGGSSGWLTGLTSTTPTRRSYSTQSGSSDSNSTTQGSETLSQEYATPAFMADVIQDMPDYPEEWDENWYGWGSYSWGYWGWGSSWNWWIAHRSLANAENSFSLSKMRYKFQSNPSASTTLKWHEIFVPENDPATPEDESLEFEIIRERTWTLNEGENESPEFEIDPSTEDRGNGYYTIMMQPVHVTVSGIGEAGKDVSGQDASPGKVVLINDGDADNDGIPDYADGYDFNSQIEEDNTSYGSTFIPVNVSLRVADASQAKVRFTYDASDPQAITRAATNPYQLPANGRIRLWTKDAWGSWNAQTNAHVPRNPQSINDEGDFIQPGVEYTLEELGIGNSWGGFTVYAEVVKVSGAVADIPINVELDPTGDMGFVWSDQLRCTGVAVRLFQRSPRQESFTEASRFSVSRVTKAPTEPSLAVDEQFLPGAYQEFKIEIRDPRQNLTNVKIHGHTVHLNAVSGGFETPQFIGKRHDTNFDITGTPQLTIALANGTTSVEFNPVLPYDSIGKVNNMPVEQRNLSREIDSVITGLKEGGWSPVAYGYDANDSGAFGKEVHKQVGTPYQNKTDWIVNGYFKELSDGRHQYLGTTKPIDLTGTTEVDILRLKRGYRLNPMAILNKENIEFVADIKTTSSGTLNFNGSTSQGQRLLSIVGGDKKRLNIVVPYERWTSTRGWFKNNKFLAISAIFSTASIAGSVWNTMHAHEYDEDFAHALTTARQIKLAIDQNQDYDLSVKPLLILYRIQIHTYLSHFMPADEVNTLATVAELYRIMATSDVDWLNLN